MWHLFCGCLMFLSLLLLFLLCSCSLGILLIVHLGYLHCCRTSSRCFNCSSSSLELEHTALALWVRVLITLYLHVRLWWLSHWRYRSVWVGFLWTLVVKFPSSWGVTRVSRKGMEPSCLGSSVVNWMAGSTELMCCRNSSLLDCFNMTNVSSICLFYHLGGFTVVVRALSSKNSMYILATTGLTGDPNAAPWVCSWNWPWNRK